MSNRNHTKSDKKTVQDKLEQLTNKESLVDKETMIERIIRGLQLLGRVRACHWQSIGPIMSRKIRLGPQRKFGT